MGCYLSYNQYDFFRYWKYMAKFIDMLLLHITTHKKKFYLCVIVGAIVAGFVYYRFNPNSFPFFPKCIFLMLTGMKCPGCGSQRAIHALLHADIKTAFSYNVLLVLSIPYVILLLGVRIYQLFNPYSPLILKVQRSLYIWIFFAIAMTFFVARNIFSF